MLQMLSPRFGGVKAPSSPSAASDAKSPAVEWKMYDVQVPPGSLGVILHETATHRAVIEKFAPLPSGDKGALELHGGITPGSVIVGVNEHDFVVGQMTMKDIGRVLSQTAMTKRTLRVQVPIQRLPPPPTATSSNQKPESDSSKLLQDVEISSSSYEPQNSNVRNAQPPSPPTSTFAAVLGKKPPSPISVPRAPQTLSSTSSPRNAVLSPTSPFARVASASSSQSPRSVTAPPQITVNAPPGPLGLNLDGAITTQAVVLGFTPLPDGSKGALELHGGIVRGCVLVGVNNEDVSRLNRDQVQAKLVAAAQQERLLTFQMPLMMAPPMPKRLSASGEDLDVRRREELGLIMKYDDDKLKRKECWFLIDMKWMQKWAAFVAKGGPLPGPITNGNLLEGGWEKRLANEVPGRPDQPKPGLHVGRDYRGVTPMVWCLLAELHGAGHAPVMARYLVDLYGDPLTSSEVTLMLREAKLKAADLAKEIRERSMFRG